MEDTVDSFWEEIRVNFGNNTCFWKIEGKNPEANSVIITVAALLIFFLSAPLEKQIFKNISWANC